MRLVLLELNEINFDAVNFYIKRGVYLPGFKKLIKKGIINTESETKYEYLEPWIQWASVHTGKTFDEHKVFRLGDFVNSSDEQVFEQVEKAGFSVGAVSPMNASNKLRNPAYFIPDPWTQTPCDNSFFSKSITDAIVQAVNDNSQSKLTYKTISNLGLAFIGLVKPTRYIQMARYALNTIGRPWRKALFLDMLLYEIHKTLFKRKNPNFSTLFLNAGAHIQHHYFFNSSYVDSPELKNPTWYIGKDDDPFLEMLKVYDGMLLDLLELPNTEIIVATGLSQKPYEQLKFYYRLKDHASFLKKVGIEFTDVVPRMTRDFLVSFDNEEQALEAEQHLSKILVNHEVKLFEEIDNRGKDIFVVLTYPAEITDKTFISFSGEKLQLLDLVTFVAIKNGEHQSKGFAYFSDGVSEFAPPRGSHVAKIHKTVLQFFGIGS
ncbi:alkaline phosphatase family protein [Gammaproteobacteria bacterium]|nr:alkaline phosphatase family protein [Gammaproteobacteria bacterium]